MEQNYVIVTLCISISVLFRYNTGNQRPYRIASRHAQTQLDSYSRFDTIPACDGWTDGRTERRTDGYTTTANNTRGKNDTSAEAVRSYSRYSVPSSTIRSCRSVTEMRRFWRYW